MSMTDREVATCYANATIEVCHLCREGKSIDDAVRDVVASPRFPLGLMQIAQLEREARLYVPEYLKTLAMS